MISPDTGLHLAIASAREAYTKTGDAEEHLQAERAKKAELEQALAADRSERDRLIDLEDRDAALRLVDGDETVSLNPARTRKIARLSRTIPATKAAIPLQDERIAAAELALEAAKRPLSGTVLDISAAVQMPAVEQIRTALATLLHPLVDLLAGDKIRARTIGRQFVVSADRTGAVFSGEMVVEKLLSGIPERVRPAELSTEDLVDLADDRAAAIVEKILEGDQ